MSWKIDLNDMYRSPHFTPVGSLFSRKKHSLDNNTFSTNHPNFHNDSFEEGRGNMFKAGGTHVMVEGKALCLRLLESSPFSLGESTALHTENIKVEESVIRGCRNKNTVIRSNRIC